MFSWKCYKFYIYFLTKTLLSISLKKSCSFYSTLYTTKLYWRSYYPLFFYKNFVIYLRYLKLVVFYKIKKFIKFQQKTIYGNRLDQFWQFNSDMLNENFFLIRELICKEKSLTDCIKKVFNELFQKHYLLRGLSVCLVFKYKAVIRHLKVCFHLSLLCNPYQHWYIQRHLLNHYIDF